MTKENLTEYFTYLDELRESGQTNMFGGAKYIEASFDVDRGTAKKVLIAWMQTFDDTITMNVRVDKAFAKGLV
jgi:hypothetical protein